MKRKETGILGPDGIQRTQAQERRINNAVYSCLREADGEYFLNYLKSITTHVTAGPEVTDAHLRHLEGQRFITAVIAKRFELGLNAKKEISDE